MLPSAEPSIITEPAVASPGWRLATRIAFRFSVLYFTLYVLTTQMLSSLVTLPVGNVPDASDSGWGIAVFSWVARDVLHAASGFATRSTGSGDRTLDWAQSLVLLVAAAAGTLLWSLVTRRRDHPTVQKWFRVFLRFALGATMVGYGIAKVVPLQMPAPSLSRLLEPYGSFSPMGVLWASIGASRSYEIFVGLAETAGGVLLFVPQLALLGALITLADVVEVFMLNMTYDVPVKLFSFHLILMALFLLAPDARRLANVIVFDRRAEPSARPRLFSSRTAWRAAVAAQIVFGVYLLGVNVYGARRSWYAYGGGAAKSPLYGIWNVDELSNDGQPRPPLLTDTNRWRRAVFQTPERLAIQVMNESYAAFGSAIDMKTGTLVLSKPSDKNWKGHFTFQQPDADTLSLDGSMDGHQVHAVLHRMAPSRFLLLSRGFHWIQEMPFNR